jgi:hypothetical protein
MSRVNDHFIVPVAPDDAIALCRRVAGERNWPIDEAGAAHLVLRYPWHAAGVGFQYAQILRIDVGDDGSEGTEVTVAGKIGGVGPHQRGVLRRTVESFRATLESAAAAAPTGNAPAMGQGSVASELEHLAALLERGVLSNAEFQAAKAKLLV